jgi:Undecaprenyl-phosphate galactose phosphotransferase WbaP
MLFQRQQSISLNSSIVAATTEGAPCSSRLTAAAMVASDITCFFVALVSAILISRWIGQPFRYSRVFDGVAVTLATLLTIFAASLYPALGTDVVQETKRLVECVFFVHLANMLFLYISAADGYRSFAISFCALSMLLSPFGRAILRHLLSTASWWGESVTVIGSGESLYQVVEFLRKSHRLGLYPAKIVDRKNWSERRAHPKASRNFASIFHPDRRSGITTAIIVRGPSGEMPFADSYTKYQAAFSKFIVVSPDISRLHGFSGETIFGGDLSGQISKSLMLTADLRLKRCVDLLFSAFLLVVMSPVLLIVAVAVKLTSPGTIFFRHQRMGKDGLPFHVCKFRTMARDSDVRLAERLANSEDARQEWKRDHKLRNDPRITPIGGFLRKFSVDELPQFWNVLRGEMSVVGPRPISYEEISRYGDKFAAYSNVRPGITGLWQVSGRNEMSYSNRVGIDTYYVDHWSPWMDLYILVRTVTAVFSSRGAY